MSVTIYHDKDADMKYLALPINKPSPIPPSIPPSIPELAACPNKEAL